jgi:hypothetical protein
VEIDGGLEGRRLELVEGDVVDLDLDLVGGS